MSEKVMLNDDGTMNLDLNPDYDYIMTKWYKSSLAIFEEKSFRKYLSELDTKFSDNGNGRSVIKYFLSAAVTMIYKEGDGWNIPMQLREYAASDEEDLYVDKCSENFMSDHDLPVMLIASKANVEEAVNMTKEKHTAQ